MSFLGAIKLFLKDILSLLYFLNIAINSLCLPRNVTPPGSYEVLNIGVVVWVMHILKISLSNCI